ncbi:MAG: hypothetical protein QOF02_2840 [Blastocatellia bacterium]|jgi:outer membrane protein assembly factor BamE (lipoprotein component of BamABCDE complex)|nr:hypothetical protein [Blastocatellia bacterium]
MTPISTRIIARGAWLALGACLFISLLVAPASRQASASAQTDKADKPLYHDYKGIELGMTQDEVRKKLGNPKDKEETQDFYLFSDKETAQIFYQTKKVVAVTVSYLGAKTSAPEAKAVFGSPVEPTADGRVYKLVRYKDAGYWVSYSRINGDEPMVTVTMQKLQ